MDRGYQHSLTEKLLSEINKTHRNWKSSLLKQNTTLPIFKEPPITSYKKGKSLQRATYSTSRGFSLAWLLTFTKSFGLSVKPLERLRKR